MAVVLLISIILVWRSRQWPLALALWICHLGLLVPLLGLTEHPHFSSDRYNILASLGWSVLLAAGMWTLRERSWARIWASGLSLAGVAVLALLSFRQVAIWQNNSVFFQYQIDQLGDHPARADLFWRKGNGHKDLGETSQAWTCYSEALRLQPDNSRFRRSRGEVNLEMGRWDDAIADLRVAFQKQPDSENGLLLGIALARKGDWSAAASLFEATLRREPDSAQAHFNLAKVREHQQQFDKAMAHYRMALQCQPDWPEAMAGLARFLITAPGSDQRAFSEAVQLAAQACRITQFQQPQFLPILADAYAAAGRWEQAIATARQTADLAQSLRLTNLVAQSIQQLESFRKRQANQRPEP
jgi:protein O-mannosyl-transferase